MAVKKKRILIANQKGGTGKTMIADQLVSLFNENGIPCEFVDLAQQGGAINANKMSPENVPNARVSIIDTPGGVIQEMRQWMEVADLILIPTKPYAEDMNDLERMFLMIEQNKIKTPVICVVNDYERFNMPRRFFKWLQSTYPKMTYCILPHSQVYSNAMFAGKSAVGYRRTHAASIKLNELYKTIIDTLKIKEA